MMQVIKDFLPTELSEEIKQILLGDGFPWYYMNGVNHIGDGHTQFIHGFYNYNDWNSDKGIMQPFLERLGALSLIRIKANLQLPTTNVRLTGMHADIPSATPNIKTALYYVTSNDGKTVFENGEQISSIQNTLVIFDASVKHSGTTCTGSEPRVVINFNYIPL